MALRFLDSFDHYATADIAKKWDTVAGTQNISLSHGRWGTFGARIFSNGVTLTKNLDSQQTWIIGGAIVLPAINTAGVIFGVMDTGSFQCELRTDGAGRLLITRNGTTILGPGTTFLIAGVSYYLEFKVTIANSPNGVAEAKIDGVTEISSSTLDTQNTANATANQIRLGPGAGGGFDYYLDDFYVCDGTGGVNDDFLGDTRVQTIFPDANGNSSQLVGSDGNSTDNYLLVDETTPNTADYVESSTVGDKDTYNYGSLTPTTGAVYGVQILPYAAKTDAGVRSIQAIARHSATEEDTGADMVLSTTVRYFMDVRDTKPGGGSWSISDVNAAEFGVKVTA